jgi:hypothetical protein
MIEDKELREQTLNFLHWLSAKGIYVGTTFGTSTLPPNAALRINELERLLDEWLSKGRSIL